MTDATTPVAGGSASGPQLLFATQHFGIRSEVWMYRHATMMRSHVTVLCREHCNQDIYPHTPRCDVRSIPVEIATSPIVKRFGRNLFTRAANFAANRVGNYQFGFYPGTVAERNWFCEQVDRIDPRMCLIQYGTNATHYAPLFASMGRPFAVHFHGHDLSSAVRKPHYVKQLLRVAQRASALIVVAKYMAEWLVDHGVAEAKIHRIPYGVPIDSFKPATGERPRGDEVELLMVGRLTKKKAPLLSLRAFAKCHAEFPQTRLRIIGDGQLLDQCRALVDELAISQAVRFMGAQPTDVVRLAMQEADLFVQHSVISENGDKEGWPVAVAEAAGSGLPIISTRHASIPEQVIDGETGLLCDEGDWETMADNMQQLVADARLRNDFAVRAREHISQWDTQGQVAKLEALLLACSQSSR